MADDELTLSIDKAFWPRGVVRGLTPVLRALGDKHGNLVIAAQPLKGEILVKGPADQIESAKEGLREIIEEHFPDAPLPAELEEGTQPVADEDEAQYGAEVGREIELQPEERLFADDDEPQVMPGRPRAPSAVPADLVWQCIRKSSCFIRKSSPYPKRLFSTDPNNTMGLYSQSYSGLAAEEVLGVRAIKNGIKETVELVKSKPKSSKKCKPATALMSTGLSKCKKIGLKQLDHEIGKKFYRRDLLDTAKKRYGRVLQSFKKNKLAERSIQKGRKHATVK